MHRGHRVEYSDGVLRAGVLGTGGFMAVGAYACYKLMTAFPDVSMFVHVLLAGVMTAVSVFCLACLACASKGSIWRLRHWPRSSFWCGCLTGALVLQLLGLGSDQLRRSASFWRLGDRAKHRSVGDLSVLPVFAIFAPWWRAT